MTVPQIALVLLLSSAIAALTMVYMARDRRVTRAKTAPAGPSIAYLFESDMLIHATPLGQSLLNRPNSDLRWNDIRTTFDARFPDLPQAPPKQLDTITEVGAVDPEDQGVIKIEAIGRHMRRELVEADAETAEPNRHAARSLRILHKRLDEMCQNAPFPMWRLDADNAVVWSNAAYEDLARSVGHDPDRSDEPVLTVPRAGDERRKARVSIERKNSSAPAWFEVTATPSDGGLLHHAINIDAVIQAEIAQRNFVQTLAKTFAQLSIGLAIFDRNRQLVLFNPALVDLTGLQAEFLSARPELLTFFDNLRDRRIMPEPKNYATWRQDTSNMIAAAADGHFQETWSLHSGQTFRVSGRPHPDGAIAFLIEDITEEISQTRAFRAEVALGHSLLDTFDDAIAVFSPTGTLTFCNTAYRELWNQAPDESFAETTLFDCIRVWQNGCAPNPAWGEIPEFVAKVSERAAWSASIRYLDGTDCYVNIAPIASGETLVRFETHSTPALLSEM